MRRAGVSPDSLITANLLLSSHVSLIVGPATLITMAFWTIVAKNSCLFHAPLKGVVIAVNCSTYCFLFYHSMWSELHLITVIIDSGLIKVNFVFLCFFIMTFTVSKCRFWKTKCFLPTNWVVV